MRYCQSCATRNGWPFVYKDVNGRSKCQICENFEYWPCVDVPVSELPVPGSEPLNEQGAIYNVVAWCEQQLKDARHELLIAVGDRAAQKARIEAIQAEGYTERPHLGVYAEDEKINDAKVVTARHRWRQCFYAYKRVFEMAYPAGR